MKLWKLHVCWLCLSLFCFAGTAQSKRFLQMVDSVPVEVNPYLTDYNWQSFFRSGAGKATINPDQADLQLLEAAVFFAINRYRVRKHQQELEFHESLQRQTQASILVLSSRKFDVPEHPTVQRYIARSRKTAGFQGRLQTALSLREPLVPFRGIGTWHYNRKRTDSPYQLYLGPKPDSKDSTYIPVALKGHTYASFATALVADWAKGKLGQHLRSPSFTYLAVSVNIDYGSLRKKRPPTARAMLLLGGYRTQALISKEEY